MNQQFRSSEYETMRRQDLQNEGAVSRGEDFLDRIFPLAEGSHRDVASYEIYYQHLCAFLRDGRCVGLRDSVRLAGFSGHRQAPTSILLRNGELSVEMEINPASISDGDDSAAISCIRANIWMEREPPETRDIGNSVAMA